MSNENEKNVEEILKSLEANYDKLSPEEKQRADNFIQKYKISKAKEDFYVYLRLIAPLLIPEKFRDGKHIHLFCNELMLLEQQILDGKRAKLQFFLPPGAMKTLTLCLFVSWIFGRHPDWYVLHIGHTSEFAKNVLGQRIRDIINLPEYRIIFPDTQISKSTRSKDEWKTTSGGFYKATGVGNQIAGRRAHITICDDVISEQTARSKTERMKINEWYIPGLRSRLLPSGGAEIIVNTRWHLYDLSGYIIETDKNGGKDDWKIIAIPAILDGELGEKAAKLLGKNVGESYWEEYWPKSNFETTKATSSPAVWNALYMQNPVPEDGNIFKKHHFMYWDTIKNRGHPDVDHVILSFDTAFSTKDSADYSAWGAWGIFKKDVVDIEGRELQVTGMYLLEAGKDRLTYPELAIKIKELMYNYNAQWAIIEDKASGQSLIQDLLMQGIPVVPYKPEMDKETRAHACVPFCEMGLIWIPEHEPWAKDFLTELWSFPNGAYDDQVDQFTQAVLWMRDNMQLKRPDYVKISNDYDEADDPLPNHGRQTYWKATLGKRRY